MLNTLTTPTAPHGIWSPLAAPIYDPFLALGERRGMRERRRRLLGRARGRVLEIGAGTGLNLAHYPDGLDELVLSEPADPMARRLESRLRRSRVRASVLRAGAEALPVATDSVDTVVSTMVLCTVPDPAAALDEIRRVLRSDGRLLFCEHVRSDSNRLARWQERLARPWEAFADGCRCNQDTVGLIERALHIERLECEEWRGMPGLVRPLILGEASTRLSRQRALGPRPPRYVGCVSKPELVLRSAYQAFNDRDIEAAAGLMHPDVDWPNAWEGGRVRGRVAVRRYWERQFAAISSHVQPEQFTTEPDGSVTVDVHQVVHDARTRELLSDSRVRHRYRLEAGLIVRMDVLRG